MKKGFEKYKSRKFIAMLLGVVLGVALIFGVDGTKIGDVAGAFTSLASVLGYIIVEGKLDMDALEKEKSEKTTEKEVISPEKGSEEQKKE